MKNKKTLMFISSIMILIFHLWINITSFKIESYIREICIIGVDIFFFISAYSISKRKIINYKEFLINRFIHIYLKFILFTIIYGVYKKIDISLFIKTILGIELFENGGGSFLWFIPAIMIVYILLPIYKKIDNNKYVFPIICVIYLISVISLSLLTNINTIFIFLNRIPILLCGYYFAKYNILEKLSKKNYYILASLLTICGLVLTYIFFINRIHVEWFYDVNYIIHIPLILGIILLFDNIKTNKLFNAIGNSTLEIYGLQMIFGFKIANVIYSTTNSKLLTNILVISIIIILSILLSYSFKKIKEYIYSK